MRKLLSFLCLMLVCLLLPVMAQADSLYEWNRSCRRKTVCETKVYSSGDTTRVIATLPTNTYVKPGFGTDEWLTITFMTSSGMTRSGLVKPACIGSAVIFFTDAEGDRRGIQELQYYEMYGKNPPPGVLDKPLPGGNGETVGEPVSKGNAETADKTTTSGSTSTTKKSSSTTKTTTTKTATSDVNTDVLWQGELISVKTWGFHSSVILVDGKEQSVPTHELTFSENVDAAKRIAYIHAPRTGRCYLRAKASDKADVLDKCKAGTVVQVVKYGKSYCQIVFEGQVGYVQAACLKFAEPEVEPMCTWRLSYNGRMTGAAQVPIRSDKSNDSASVVKLRSGTEVTVFSKSGSWYEVEYEGLHGFVHKNFLRME
nr:SH3 domain-containing protein [Clostridia bacterium]